MNETKCPSCGNMTLEDCQYREDGEDLKAKICTDCGWWG